MVAPVGCGVGTHPTNVAVAALFCNLQNELAGVLLNCQIGDGLDKDFQVLNNAPDTLLDAGA